MSAELPITNDPTNPPALEIFITVWMGRLLGRFFKEYVDRLELNGTEQVLELGPSAGNSTRHLASRLQKGGSVTAVDISPRWIEVARKRLAKFSNVRFIAGDIRRLGLKAGSYDAIFISFVVHDIPAGERLSTLKATSAALASGGKLFLREPLRFIDQAEIASLMQACGLSEISTAVSPVKTQGMVFEGIYVK